MDCEKWYNHQPEAKEATIPEDFSIQTDWKIKSHRLDIVFKDYKSKTCLLIDISVSTDNNRSVIEYNKISKYKDMEIDIEKMWHLKTTIMPVIVWALGMIKKGRDKKHINKIPDSSSWYEIQKIALCRTAHLLRKVL